MPARDETTVELTVMGKDRKGVVASFTNCIFRRGGNIEAVNQHVMRGLFGMHLEASFSRMPDKSEMASELQELGKKFGMEVGVHYHEMGRHLNLAVMVTRKSHCLKGILDAVSGGKLRVKIPVIIGSEGSLRNLALKRSIPFYVASNSDQVKREKRILRLLQKHNVDIIALARYMRILGPNFVWRYPNKIINIHPSILPAFPGALAYEQAYEKGARIIGCTAHFATTELDEGPIIWQEALSVKQGETLESIKLRGQTLEAKALVKALELYTKGKLEVRWGRVYLKT